VVCLTGLAAAQDIQAFKPAVGTWNYLSVNGAAVAEPGLLMPSLYVNYGRNPLVHRDADGNILELVIEDLTTFDMLVVVGLHERVEVGLGVPVGYSGGDESVSVDGGSGLGDVRVLPKLVLVGAEEGFGLAIATPFSFPTGDLDGGSERHFVARPHLVADYRGARWSAAVNAGYRWRPTNRAKLEPLTVGSGLTYGVAGMYAFGDGELQALAEVFGTRFTGETEGQPTPLEGLVGMRLFSSFDLAFTLSAGLGLIPDYSAPEFRVISGLAWTPSGESKAFGPALRVGDRDGDGVQDALDACVNVPEDADGFQDADGCPEADNDLDGVADAEDQCPARPEDADGFEDEDGCPEVGPAPVAAASGVAIDGDRLDLPERIFFETNRAKLRPESFPVLTEVARLLRRRPDLGRVRVEGHTDSKGGAKHNELLSAQRAESVVLFLVSTGLPLERFDSAGVGDRRPVTDNSTRQGRALNRRVEFVLLKAEPAAVEPEPTPIAAPVAPEPEPTAIPVAPEPEPIAPPVATDPEPELQPIAITVGPAPDPEPVAAEPAVVIPAEVPNEDTGDADPLPPMDTVTAIIPESGRAAAEIVSIEAVEVTGSADAVTIEVTLTGRAPENARAHLNKHRDMLVIELPGVAADRQRPKASHDKVQAVLVHTAGGAAYIKVRFKKPLRGSAVEVSTTDASLHVRLSHDAPKSPAVAGAR